MHNRILQFQLHKNAVTNLIQDNIIMPQVITNLADRQHETQIQNEFK